MLSLITVVHRPEVPYIKLQAKSIQQYFDKDYIQSIHVIVNDDDSVCDLIDKSWYGNLADRVNITPRSIYGYHDRVTGWDSQQLLKLMTAARMYTSWSMVLDAKTFFVKKCTPELLFTDNKAVTDPQYPQEVFTPARQCVERTFNLSLDRIIGPAGVPFLFHTNTAQSLITDIEALSKTTFADWFQSNVRYPTFLTEFFLYSGYVKHKYGNIRELYTPGQKWDCINLADWQIDKFDEIYNEMRLFKTLTVSVQSRAWPLLTEEQKLKYVTLLKTKNIVDDIEDTLAQLNTVVIN
jgi:hypothetical protein